MKMTRVVLLIVSILAFATGCTAQTAAIKGVGSVLIVIEPIFNGKPLVLDTGRYLNEHGDTLSVSLLRYYISNISFIGHAVHAEEKDSYHLVSTEDSGSNAFQIQNVPAGSYNSMRFILGVDSMANVSGAMGGDLDPAKGMYWAWNTGYINAKLEGRSKVCKTLHQAFEFHIGGYLPPFAASRQLALPSDVPVVIKAGSTTVLHIKADIAAWFKGAKLIDLSKMNSVLIPCADAMMVADNYRNMFSISAVINP